MIYEERFSDLELGQIVEEGFIYMCACPAQVAEAIRKVRELYRYQLKCLENPENDPRSHEVIAKTAAATHSQLQDCMEQILVLENWDRKTLTMPPNLRAKQMKEISRD